MCRRVTDTRRLLGYLFTEGLAGQRGLDSAHVDARVIAGYQPPGTLQPERRTNGRADVSRLAALLDAPVRAGGVGKDVKSTYHLVISAAPTDRLLTDLEWAEVAEHYVDRLGLAKPGDDDAVRWVAVRHADNHVHVVATLVRQDGRKVFPHHDFYRAREASLEVERRFGLTRTSAVDRTGHPETTRGEQRKHQAAVRAAAEAGRPAPAGPDREVLRARVRAALAGTQDWEEFAGRLRASGVQVRERYSTRNPGELIGYAVALLPTGARDWEQGTTWFGGGKLAPDLSLPQLRARWEDGEVAGSESVGWEAGAGRAHTRAGRSTSARPGSSEDLSELDRQRLWAAAQQAVHRADTEIGYASSHPFDPAAQATAQAAAASAGEVLGAVSWLVHRTRGGPLHTAAEHYGRAARDVHRRTVPATTHSRSTRTAAGALLRAGIVKRAETRQLLSLLVQLTALSESLARLRETQGQAAQVRAARRAAEQLTHDLQRRAAAASAAMPRAVSNAVTGAATRPPVTVQLPPSHRAMPGPATRGWSPSR